MIKRTMKLRKKAYIPMGALTDLLHDCDISIATTGLAGPNTDKSGLPIGLCFIAIGTKETVLVYRYKFDGTRQEICEKAVNYALFLAFKQLKNA